MLLGFQPSENLAFEPLADPEFVAVELDESSVVVAAAAAAVVVAVVVAAAAAVVAVAAAGHLESSVQPHQNQDLMLEPSNLAVVSKAE